MSPLKNKTGATAALTSNARVVLEKRYLKKGADGKVAETPEALFRRVAQAVATADLTFDPASDAGATARRFEDLLKRLMFLPNSPTLMNAGTEPGTTGRLFRASDRRFHGKHFRNPETHGHDPQERRRHRFFLFPHPASSRTPCSPPPEFRAGPCPS